MSECDICADREPGSCGGAPEKSPSSPLFLFLFKEGEGRAIVARANGSDRRDPYFWNLEAFSIYLRIVSLVQHVSRGMLYPTSWPMLTSISSATLKARSIACCA